MTFACAIFIRMPFAESDGYGGLILSRIGFVLICPSRDVTDALLNCVDATLISTHTPLAGRDATFSVCIRSRHKITIWADVFFK